MSSPSLKPDIQVEPWHTEKILTVLVKVVAVMVWIALAVSIIGLLYVAIIGLFFFIAHVIFVAHVRGNGVKLGPNQFPELYAGVEKLALRMGFEKVPEAYILQAGGVLNALATKFLKSHMIILYSDLLEACGDNTAARDMIIAHELGHLKHGHLKWHWFLLPGLLFPFLGQALSRAREYTCDRYGLAGAGDKKGAMLGLAILAAGAEKGPQVNLQAMAEQVKVLNTGLMTIGTWLSSHPPIAKRFIALESGLAPVGYYANKGALRALGILGAIYVIPTVLTILAVSVFGVMNLAKQTQETEASLLTSADGRSQISLPAGWVEDKALHETADLEASHRTEGMFVIVLSDAKGIYQQMSLEQHSADTRSHLVEPSLSPQVSGPTRLDINGHPSLQYEIRTAVDNLKIVYLHTTVETAEKFHQIVAWTLEPQIEKNRPVLQKVVESFKEIP